MVAITGVWTAGETDLAKTAASTTVVELLLLVDAWAGIVLGALGDTGRAESGAWKAIGVGVAGAIEDWVVVCVSYECGVVSNIPLRLKRSWTRSVNPSSESHSETRRLRTCQGRLELELKSMLEDHVY